MEQIALIERLERLERENSRIKRFARLALGSMVVLIVLAGIVPKATTQGPPILKATEFDLLGPNRSITAKLQTLRNGPNLTFYDNAGKVVADIGWINDSTSAQAGLAVFDGNSVLAGNGVARATVGYTSRSASGTGVGLASYDETGLVRASVGQSLNGSESYEVLYDSTGALRTGITIPQSASIGYFNQDANGLSRVSLFESADGLVTGLSLRHQNGIEGADAIANDEAPFVGANFATWNADHTHIASIIGVAANIGDAGFVNTFLSDGTLSGHLP